MTFGLPLADVRGTSIGDKCPIKVDYPCQPGKYRAYNGYCNNVQNPNWGVSNRRYLRYIQSDYADGISVPRQRPDGQVMLSRQEDSPYARFIVPHSEVVCATIVAISLNR